MTDPQFHLYVDSADLNELRTILPHPLIYGVTTNPTLMRHAGLSRRALPGLVDQVFAWGASADVHACSRSGRSVRGIGTTRAGRRSSR